MRWPFEERITHNDTGGICVVLNIEAHFQFTRKVASEVFETALLVHVPGNVVLCLEDEPNPLKAAVARELNAAADQFATDPDLLVRRGDDGKHFAPFLVYGKEGRVTDDAIVRGSGN